MASGHRNVFASTEKTTSYKQLKSDFADILKEHGELQNKLSRQQSQLHNAKAARKRLEKENQELRDHLSQEDKMHKEAVADISEKLGGTNADLKRKIEVFEREMEKLGIDPITFAKLPGEDLEDNRREMKTKLDNLITNLDDSVAKNTALVGKFQDLMDQCKLMQQDDDAPTEVVT